MFPRSRIVSVLSLAVLWTTPALAAPTPAPGTAAAPTVAQENLVRMALDRVPAIVSAQRALEANRARLEAARGGYYPAINLNAGVSRTNAATTTATGGDAFDLSQASVGLHEELYNFGRTAAQVDVANANVDVSAGTLREQGVEVAHGVRRAYINWVQARGLEDQARVQMQNDKRLYEQALAFFKAGTRARLDVTRARTTFEQAHASLLAAHTATDQARAALATAIGEHRMVEGVPGFAPVPTLATRKLDQLETLAVANHPLLAGAQARVALAHASLESAEAADKPDLGADASYGARARELAGAPTWNLGVSVGWPLYNGGAYERQREAARLSEQAAAADVRNQADQVLLGVDNAYLAVEGAAIRLPATDAELASARENLFQAEGRYRAGVGSIIEVSDAQALLATAEADQLRARAAYHLAIADLIAAVGLTGTEPQTP